MGPVVPLVVFHLDEQRYGLPLAAVERVVRAVEVTPLPKAPEIVLGVVNVRGRVVPVVDLRRRFRLPARGLAPSDQFVLARAARRTLAMVVDSVAGLTECPAESVVAGETVLPGLGWVAGLVKLPDGLVLIHDPGQFLALEEETALDAALAPAR